jgi:hypothetical protein
MTIDTSGKYWKGSDASDLQEYLAALSASNYLATEFRFAKCSCGSDAFRLAVDANEGAAQRTCAQCGAEHFIADSQEYWEEATPKAWKCVSKCKSKTANICVGFALRADRQDVHWIYIGTRCTQCGILGCYGDWKIDYSPSLQLLEGES